MSELRCPVCGGSNLSPPTLIAMGHGNLSLQYERNPTGGFFSKDPEYFGPPVGRACADCGFMLLFLPPKELAALQASFTRLHPRGS